MKKLLLVAGTIVGAGLLFTAFYLSQLRRESKLLSPETKVRYANNDFNLTVFYCRPQKRGRKIFGGLVPFGQLWRTGANEATVLATSNDILMNGQPLESGRYLLLTIPQADHWKIILNSDVPGWGINLSTGKPYHNPKKDVLVFDVPIIRLDTAIEHFTISIDERKGNQVLSLQWDRTRVEVLISSIN